MAGRRADPGHLRLVRRRPPGRASPSNTTSWCAGTPCVWHNQLPDWLTTGVEQRHDQQRPAARPAAQAHHRRGHATSRARSGSGTSPTSSSPTATRRRLNPNDFWVSHLGARHPRRRLPLGARRPTRTRCCSTTTTTSPARTAPTPRATRSTPGCKTMLAQRVPIDGIGDQGHLDTQYGFPTKMTDDLQRYADLGLKVAITEADVRTFVNNATDQVPTDHLATFAQPYEFDADAQGLPRRAAAASPSPSGASATRTPGFPASSPARATRPSTTSTSTPSRRTPTLQQDLGLAAHGAPRRPSS